MRFLRRFQYVLLFIGVLAFCSYKVVAQFSANQARHVEMRETFLRLRAKDDPQQLQRLYVDLIEALEKESTESLLDDQRHSSLVVAIADPSHNDLIWKYHCSINREIEKRQKRTLVLNKQSNESPFRRPR